MPSSPPPPPPPSPAQAAVSYAPTASLQLQPQLQRLCNRRPPLPNRPPNRRQPILQAFAALSRGPPIAPHRNIATSCILSPPH